MYNKFCYHLLVNVHLGWLHFLGTVNGVAMSTEVFVVRHRVKWNTFTRSNCCSYELNTR